MDQQIIISSLEARAKAVGLSISEACRRANIHPTTFSRWKLSERNARPVGASIKSLEPITKVIIEAEEDARRTLGIDGYPVHSQLDTPASTLPPTGQNKDLSGGEAA